MLHLGKGFRVLRVIPVIKPGSTAFTFALARNDDDETAARQKAAADRLVAGAAKEVEPDPTIWGLIDSIKCHHNGQD
jgi:hypothetical protein